MVTGVSDLKTAAADLRTRVIEVYSTTVDLVEQSIVEGSDLTGSPGQPEDLREGEWFVVNETDWLTLIATNEKSARSVEDGISYKHHGVPLKKLHSSQGGFHSRALTEASFDKILSAAVQQSEARDT